MGDNEQSELMDDLAAAWDQAEEDVVEEVEDGDDGNIWEPEEEAPDSEDTDEPADVEASADSEPEADEPTEPVDHVEDPAPSSLPPAAREAWNDTPPAMKEAIAKRERDFQVGIQKYAESARRAEGMDRTLAPYQQLFAMNGGNPGQTINGLLQTASVLQMGAPGQKAEAVANIIKQFGVDIQALDNLLVGQAPPPEIQQNTQIQDQVTQAIAPYQQALNQIQQQQAAAQQQAHGQVMSELEQFATNPKNEFYGDVRLDMADIMDMASKRGIKMGLEDAYNKACLMHPEISKIVSSRTSTAQVAEKRKAATSVAGSPGGPGGEPEPDDMQSAIRQAWDAAGRA